MKSGTTSDVYSVSGATADAAAGLGGPGGLSNAYGAIQAVPGAVVQQGQQGWYQTLSIRGGDIDQVGYELDGIPVNRVYDNAPQTMLSSRWASRSCKSIPAARPRRRTARASRATSTRSSGPARNPGFLNFDAGLGAPAFFHRLSFEYGGATKNRNFSYYVGASGANQDYRYVDNSNGASDPQLFYPIAYPFGDGGSRFNIWDGSPVAPGQPATVGNGLYFAPAQTYAHRRHAAARQHRQPALGHPARRQGRARRRAVPLPDQRDLHQLLQLGQRPGRAELRRQRAGRRGRLGRRRQHRGRAVPGLLARRLRLQRAPVRAARPRRASDRTSSCSSPSGRALNAATSNSLRDSNDNGVAILKLQYQRNINERSFLRLFGYSVYSNWFIHGDATQNFTCCFGAELNDYEIPSHTYGTTLTYSNQITDKHLLTFTATESQTKIQRRYFYSFPGNQGLGTAFTNLIDPATAAQTGNCFDPGSGAYASCFSGGARGTFDNPTPADHREALRGRRQPAVAGDRERAAGPGQQRLAGLQRGLAQRQLVRPPTS